LEGFRNKIYYWLTKKIFKIPEGAIRPKILTYIKALLFPKEYLFWKIQNNNFLSYNFDTDVITIYGQDFSRELLANWATLPNGTKFVLRKENDTWLVSEVKKPWWEETLNALR